MNLEQFKERLDTDAQRRCLAQEKTIKDLHEKLKDYKITQEKQSDYIRFLENRCFEHTRGVTCIFCRYKNTCQARISRKERDQQ